MNTQKKERPLSEYQLLVKTVISPVAHVRGGVVEEFCQFEAEVISVDGVASNSQIPWVIAVRIVREDLGKELRQASVGAILKVKGRPNPYFKRKKKDGFELHVISGEIVNNATFVDGYKVKKNGRGEWRWEPGAVELDDRNETWSCTWCDSWNYIDQ